MTVQFKASLTGASPPVVSFDEILQVLAEAPKKQMMSPMFVTRVYVTTSEKKPIHWKHFDVSTSTNGDNEYLNESVKEWVKYCSSKSDFNGYKIVTMAVDHLNGVSQVLPEYCAQHWQVKEKVYINGPKKKPFPTKAAKHYA